MKRAWIYGIVWAAFTALIVYTSIRTGASYEEAGGRIGAWVNTHLFFNALTLVEVKTLTQFGAKLFGHFLLFAADGLFAYLTLKSAKVPTMPLVIALACVGLVLSCLGEMIQLFVEDRNPSVNDVLINYSGYGIFLVTGWLYRRLLNRPVAE
ncbi:MAG: VanZ family protein [Bacilli bacterium]|nr:VanZ family protein [Bacilli bacterium]